MACQDFVQKNFCSDNQRVCRQLELPKKDFLVVVSLLFVRTNSVLFASCCGIPRLRKLFARRSVLSVTMVANRKSRMTAIARETKLTPMLLVPANKMAKIFLHHSKSWNEKKWIGNEIKINPQSIFFSLLLSNQPDNIQRLFPFIN